MVGKNNTDETPMETKLEETLSDPTAHFSFEDDKVGTSFALIGWPVLSSLCSNCHYLQHLGCLMI